MSRLSLAIVAALLLGAAPGTALAAQPPPPAPDLSAPLLRAAATEPTSLPTVWGCRPGQLPNPCDGSGETTVLSSTQLQPRRVARVESNPAVATPPVDCFYLYGTATNASGTNAPRAIDRDVQAPLQSQAARFSGTCRVFAPIYRQVTSGGSIAVSVLTGQTRTSSAQNVAFSDVLGAWRDYMANDNNGRGVILVGHSQGSAMLTRLIERDIDRNAAMRSKLISAILVGGNVVVKKGQRNGGNFAYLPTCTVPAEYGCVTAYSMFTKTPSRTALFGRISPISNAFGSPRGPAYEVACTNPAALAGDGDRLSPVVRSSVPPRGGGSTELQFWNFLRPRAGTKWVIPGDRFSASCSRGNDTNALLVRAGYGSLLPQSIPWADWGLHVGEMALSLGNLVKNADAQSAAWLADRAA